MKEIKPVSIPPGRKGLTLLPLIGALYFMVSGGPYGLEELVQKLGFPHALLVLFVTPLVWSLPTALMVGELASTLPEDGGYYAWVRRALGPFWGYQEAWLSIAASVFDMAIYPTLFVLYLKHFWPAAAEHQLPIVIGITFIAVCATWNMQGVEAVGGGSALMTLILLLPFFIVTGIAASKMSAFIPAAPNAPRGDYLGGVLIAMWNYMGWDNASTVAGEVHKPQRTYPLAVLLAVVLVALTYLLPVGAVGLAGVDASKWETGAWVEVARAFGGPVLAFAVVAGGLISALGMFNALTMSYSRLPVVLAQDGYLPKIFARRLARNNAPWVAILACATIWTASLGLSFERLVLLDLLLYGAALTLEFVALIVLRVREPELARPYRVPGGTLGAVLLAVPPVILIAISIVRNYDERMGEIRALTLGVGLMLLGPVLYFITTRLARWRARG